MTLMEPYFGRSYNVTTNDFFTSRDLAEKLLENRTSLNIFHGAMSLDQLYLARPSPMASGNRCPLAGLYLCGSGAHPGGGVMGSAGRLAAKAAIEDFSSL